MSRSYRKPYATWTSQGSAASDKRAARRAWRRAQNSAVRNIDFENADEFVNPVRYEAAHNDVWGWRRDGKQRLHFEPTFNDQLHWFHCGSFTDEDAMEYALEHFEYSKRYFADLKRK